jgi:hypothetical protein
MALTVGTGIYAFLKGRGGLLFSGLSALAFLVSISSIFSFISLYIYELPTHACPFCLLQKEYHFIGYPLYLTLLGGGITGISAGVVGPFGKIKSLATILPGIRKKLILTSVILFLIFTIIVTVQIFLSQLVLE